MALDPRTPVIVGAGQVNLPGEHEREPADLLVEAANRAGTDAGAPALLSALDSVRVVRSLSWKYRDLGALVAQRLGATPSHTLCSTDGGQTPQALVHRTAADIAAGRAEVVLIGGTEAWRARMAAKKRGERPAWTTQPDDLPGPEIFGKALGMTSEVEQALGLQAPVEFYPLFEIALRHALGRSPEEHQREVSELWAGFSAVAAGNEHAALRQPLSAEQTRTPGPGNRMIGYPYTKLMSSNNAVNQSAALLLTSLERARRAGVAADRMVFPWSGAEADDTPHVSNRNALHSSPAIRSAAQACFALAGLGVGDIALVDVYSCFPSAVQVAAREIGLPLDRPLTVTGGLTFAGGPWNNYVSHSIATMAGRLREQSGVGLVTANGGLLTKHAIGLYSAAPPPLPFRAEQLGEVSDGARAVATGAQRGTVESYTVLHDRDGAPARAYLTALLPDGRRAWGASTEPATLAALMAGDVCGAAVALAGDGRFALTGEPGPSRCASASYA